MYKMEEFDKYNTMINSIEHDENVTDGQLVMLTQLTKEALTDDFKDKIEKLHTMVKNQKELVYQELQKEYKELTGSDYAGGESQIKYALFTLRPKVTFKSKKYCDIPLLNAEMPDVWNYVVKYLKTHHSDLKYAKYEYDVGPHVAFVVLKSCIQIWLFDSLQSSKKFVFLMHDCNSDAMCLTITKTYH